MRFFWEWMLAMENRARRPPKPPGRAAERRTIAALSTIPDAAELAVGPGPPSGEGPVARNTAIFSAATGISRIAGLAREIVAASYFGTSAAASAFTIAYLVPNLVANLFANAVLSAAFVPVFTDLLQRGRRKEAEHLARSLFWVMLLALGALTLVFILGAGVIMPAITGFNHRTNTLTVAMARILFPVILLLGLNGLLLGILQSHDRFTIQAISPAMWNFGTIVLLLVLLTRFPC